METKKINTEPRKFGKWVKTSITARMIMVGILILILLIPLSFTKSLIKERTIRQKEVVNEINQKWGKEVLLYGPILKVPYKTYKEKSYFSEKTRSYLTEKETILKYAYFFPKELNIKSKINPQEKKRGIYTTAVYKSDIELSGKFEKPDFSEKQVNEKDIIWDRMRLIIKTSNLKGVNNLVEMKVNKNKYSFTSKYEDDNNEYHEGIRLHNLESTFLKKEAIPKKNIMLFSMKMAINGSKQIRFIPIGKQTQANITSNWKTSKFLGEYLPYNEDKIKTNGFDAKWKVLDINRPFPQRSFEGIPNLNKYAFGVNFRIPVDEYQKSIRATKYGVLVISLTFLVFFLIQTISKINIHSFQYLMIGIALTMFYTLLISISEHSSFLKAYAIASIAVITLITLYSKSILKGIKFPAFVGICLTILYAFIFIIIQLENYALLVGSIGLFIILGIVMYTSRKIDWQNG